MVCTAQNSVKGAPNRAADQLKAALRRVHEEYDGDLGRFFDHARSLCGVQEAEQPPRSVNGQEGSQEGVTGGAQAVPGS